MIRECDDPRCRRIYVELAGEVTKLCPTCRAGMAPLSTLRGLPKGKRAEEPSAAKP